VDTAPAVWSSHMLETFRNMCIYGFEVSCALIGKHSSTTCNQETSEQSLGYWGFIPREFLEHVPVEIYVVDSVEEYPNHIGYLQIQNRPELKIGDDEPPINPAAAVIYCGLKRGFEVLEAVDKAVTESRMFNLQAELRFRLDHTLFRDLPVDQLLGKKLPIESVVVYPGDISCGDAWLEQRKAHSSIRTRHRTPLKTVISCVWSIIVNIVWLILAVHLFNLMASQAEVILLAVLILLFVQVRFSQVGAFEVFLKGQRQFRHLLKLLRDPLLQDQNTLQELEEEDNTLRKTRINMYITLGFLSLLFFIALWKIVNAIFGFI
jgi:hypothetical protein